MLDSVKALFLINISLWHCTSLCSQQYRQQGWKRLDKQSIYRLTNSTRNWFYDAEAVKSTFKKVFPPPIYISHKPKQTHWGERKHWKDRRDSCRRQRVCNFAGLWQWVMASSFFFFFTQGETVDCQRLDVFHFTLIPYQGRSLLVGNRLVSPARMSRADTE